MTTAEQMNIRNKVLEGMELMYANLLRIKSRNGENIAISENGAIRIISAEQAALQADKAVDLPSGASSK